MNIAELIDYMGQFDGSTRVFLTGADFQEANDNDWIGEFIILESIDFSA